MNNSDKEEPVQAREAAYAPYSQFLVGAALQSSDDTVITGCNVENASYGLAICAERTACVKAVSEVNWFVSAQAGQPF